MFLPFRRYLHGVNEYILEDIKNFFLKTDLGLILYFVLLLIPHTERLLCLIAHQHL